MARRLAFDLLQRQLRGVDDYLPTPSPPASWLDKSFADYCRDLAALKNLSTVGAQDWPTLEAAGWQRLAQVRNLELLRGLFRRPWSCGWCSIAGCFCRNRVTACNWACSARHRSPHAT